MARRSLAWQTFAVAATYIGTVVGAGFASGQETLRFFAAYGRAGLLGIALATVMFCAYGSLILGLGRRLGARSHSEILRHVCGEHLGRVMDALITLFVGATLAVMVAGGGAVFTEQLGIPRPVGVLITAMVTGATVLAGMRGIVAANAVVVPVLTLTVAGLTFSSINFHGLLPMLTRALPWPGLAPVKSWFVATLLYAGYNLVLSIPVLGPLGAEVEDRRALWLGALLGGTALGILGAGIKLAVGAHLPEIGRWEVPMLYLARLHSRPVQWIYTAILWAEIYTTALGCAYGFAVRTAEVLRIHYRTVVVAVTAGALVGSGFGFSRLVAVLYPVFGFVTLIVLVGLTWVGLRSQSAP